MDTKTNPFENKETSNSYSSADPVYKKSAEEIIKFQNPTEFGTESIIIDLGAGTGVSSEVLLKHGASNLTLVEPSRAMLEEAEARLGDQVNYLCASAENFYANFESTVDIVYALNCVHLFPDLVSALAGVACALKNGGMFIFNISAPTYAFENIDEHEYILIQANLDFYKALNEISPNQILSHTVELLTKTLAGNHEQLYSKDKFVDIFKSLNFEFQKSAEIAIEVDSEYQKNIWRMIALSFIQDEELIQETIQAIPLPETIKLRQAQFKFKNLNCPV